MRKSYRSLQESVSPDSLIADIRRGLDRIQDFRAANCSISLSDILMSVLAKFSLKEEALLELDRESESSLSNLQNVFGSKQRSSVSWIRKVLYKLDWKYMQNLLDERFLYLKTVGCPLYTSRCV